MKKTYIRPEAIVVSMAGNSLMDTLSVPIDNESGETIDGDDFGAKGNNWGYHDYNEDFKSYNPWDEVGTEAKKSLW